MKRAPRILLPVLLAASICVFVFAASRLLSLSLTYRAARQAYTDLADMARDPGKREQTDGAGPQIPLDFEALRAVNPDIVGWITVEGAGIDYPIVQGTDNDAYLHRTFDGQANPAGEFRCEVFAAEVAESVGAAFRVYFDGDAGFANHVSGAISRSLLQTGISPDASDRIITLSTCDYSFEDARMVVYARLEKVTGTG